MTISGVKVRITYCNGVEFTSDHDEVRPACREYANMLGEALQPTGKLADAVHIKEVALTVYDVDGWEGSTVESGEFLCPHSNDPVPA